MSRPFVITGCARSGTGYAATLFSLLGLRCGHEELFNPHQLASGALTWPRYLAGDASWLAAPLVPHLPAGTVVLHQVREPLAVIRSLVRTRHFESETPWRRFTEELCPSMMRGDGLERSARYWVHWNRMIEPAARSNGLDYRRYSVETLDAATLAELFELLGAGAIATAAFDAALERVPRDKNTRGKTRCEQALALEDLPAGEVRESVAALAEQYGYALRAGLAGAELDARRREA